MGRRIAAWALALLALISVLPPGLAAEAPGKVVFESGVPDDKGVFEVTMKVSDMTVWGIQFSLRYDPEVITPVDAKGQPTTQFSEFAGVVQDWTEVVNQDLYPEIGLLGSAWITSLDVSGEGFDDAGDAVIGSEAVDVFTFRFKRLKEGDTGLQVATEAKGEPFQEVCPEGIIAMSMYEDLTVEVVFRDAEKPQAGTSESFAPVTAPTPAEPERTAKDLLREAVLLKIGSHAAVVEGGATAIYPGEREVTAYAHDNRTFVPARFVGERLGATVDWEGETQTVTMRKDGHVIQMSIGSDTYMVDGVRRTMDAPAELTPSTEGNFRTMVPIRFVSEALGYQVEWDPARNLVVIAPESLHWDPAGEVEAQAMDEAVTTLLLFSNFV